jgi:hypothetical protein
VKITLDLLPGRLRVSSGLSAVCSADGGKPRVVASGQPIVFELPAGRRELTCKQPGYEEFRTAVDVSAAREIAVEATFVEVAHKRSGQQLALACAALAVVGGAAGGYGFIQAHAAQNDLMTDPAPYASRGSTIDKGKRSQLIGEIGLGVAAAALLASAYFLTWSF